MATGKKTGGRKTGSINKRTKIGAKKWSKLENYLLGPGLEKFINELDKLSGKDFTNNFKEVIEYVKPKQARTEHVGDPNQPINHTVTLNLKG